MRERAGDNTTEIGDLEALWQETVSGDLTALDLAKTIKPARVSEQATTPFTAAQAGADEVSSSGAARYTILEELGRGGMGVVYRARQAGLEREVAIKTISARKHASLEAAFQRESRVTGSLNHPNIIPVYDLGTDDQDRSLLAMKLVEGQPWSELISGEASELDRHLEILLKVCDAAAFAHSRGIIHCDLKPENVMVGAYGEVLVVDWGVALRLAEARAGCGPRGTPVYMAPELVEGRGAIDARTDVYLLGAILYELLTGRPPHQGQGLFEVLRAARRSEPPATEGAPQELRAICRRAMAREPAHRFASAEDFQAALKSFLSHRESLVISERGAAALEAAQRKAGAGEASRQEVYAGFAEAVADFRQARLLWRENPQAASGEREARLGYARRALANGDLGLAATQITRLPEGDEEGAVLEAERARRVAEGARKERRRKQLGWGLSGALAALLIGLTLGLAYYARTSRILAEQKRDLERAKLQVEEEKRRVEEEKRRVEAEQAETQRQRERAQARLADLRKTYELFIFRFERELRSIANPRVREVREGLLSEALSGLERLARELGDEDGDVSYQTMAGYQKLGGLAMEIQDKARARAYFEEVYRGTKAAIQAGATGPRYREMLGLAATRLGALALDSGQRTEAESLLASSRETFEELLALQPEKPIFSLHLAACLMFLGDLRYRDQDPKAALALFERALRLCQKVAAADPEFPDIRESLLTVYMRLALAYSDLGRLRESEAWLRKRLELTRASIARSPGNDAFQVDLAMALAGLASKKMTWRQHDEALQLYEQSLKVIQGLLAKDPNRKLFQFNLNLVRLGLARACVCRGDDPRAAALYQQAIPALRALASEAPDELAYRAQLADGLVDLGGIAQRRGQASLALEYLREGLAARRALARESIGEHQEFIAALFACGQSLRALGERERALACFAEQSDLAGELARSRPKNLVFTLQEGLAHDRAAEAYQELSGAEAARPYIRRSLRAWHRLVELASGDKDHRNTRLNASNRLAEIYRAQGRPDDVARVLEREFKTSEAIAAREPGVETEAAATLAGVLLGEARLAQGRNDEAIALLRSCRGRLEALVARAPERIDLYHQLLSSGIRLGSVLEARGKLEAAAKTFRGTHDAALTVARLDPTNDDLNLVVSAARLAKILNKLRRFDEARAAWRSAEEAAGRRSERFPNDLESHKLWAACFKGLAACEPEDPEAELRARRRQVAILEAFHQRRPQDEEAEAVVISSLASLGLAALQHKRHEVSLSAFEKALAMLRARAARRPEDPSAPRQIPDTLLRIAQVHQARGQTQQALTAYKESLLAEIELPRRFPNSPALEARARKARERLAEIQAARSKNR